MNTSKRVKILLVEDDEDDLLILKDYLSESELDFDICWAKNNQEFENSLQHDEPYDLVVTDYMLGSTSGIDVLKKVKQQWQDVPVILLTGKGNEKIDREAMKLGADDYFVKGQFDGPSIVRSIRYALERASNARILAENKEYQGRLAKIISAGRIARMMAHEVRSPLTNILLSVDQVRHLIGEEKEASFYLDIIIKSSEKINQIVTDMIDSTKFGEVRMEKENLVDVVKESLAMAEDRVRLKNVHVRESYSHPVIEMELDKEKIKIALLNIMINGLEAIEESNGELEVNVLKNSHIVSIRVRDNGCGMSKETLNSIFEPFYTSKPKGSGIGLTSTQNIILSHKGRIDVESEPGKGSCFTINFPLGI
jgi:signal transduction histidine kinase